MAKLYLKDLLSLLKSAPMGGSLLGIYEIQKIVSCRCSQCQQEITFVVPEDKVRRGTFPIILQNLHGSPPHKLLILITHNFQVKPFAIEDATAVNSQASLILEELFKKISLTPEERELYFHCLKEKPISIDEIVKIGSFSTKNAQLAAEKLVEKGLFKEIDSEGKFFQPLPPYAAILSEFELISKFIRNIQDDILKELEQYFVALKHQAEELRDFEEFSE